MAKEYTEEELGALLDRLKRAPAQYAMLCRWIEWGKTEIEKGEWLRLTGQSAATLKGLCDRADFEGRRKKDKSVGRRRRRRRKFLAAQCRTTGRFRAHPGFFP